MGGGLMHSNRQCDSYDKAYGRHEPWHTPCNGFWQDDFDFSADPLEYEGRHRRGPGHGPRNGQVIWHWGRFAAITGAGPYRDVS